MPAVHRHGDLRACGAANVVVGQGTVFANGKLLSVLGDVNTHGAGNTLSSNNDGTVFAGNKLVTLQGSLAAPDSVGHPGIPPATKCVVGSPNVNAC